MSDLLTPKDVRTKIFATHRISEGYDVDEVDAFLDQVSDSLQRLGTHAMTCPDSSRHPTCGCPWPWPTSGDYGD